MQSSVRKPQLHLTSLSMNYTSSRMYVSIYRIYRTEGNSIREVRLIVKGGRTGASVVRGQDEIVYERCGEGKSEH